MKKIKRRPHKVFLVICEGDTEKCYVEFLRSRFRLPVAIKSKVVGNKINHRLLNNILKELNLELEDALNIYFMYDADVKSVLDKLNSLPGKSLISDPCIELWFILHSREVTRHISSGEAHSLLKSIDTCWNSYSKGSLNESHANFLWNNYKMACQRAQNLKPNANPSTNLFQFIDDLEKEKTG